MAKVKNNFKNTKSSKKKGIKEITFELQSGKSVDYLKEAIAQLQYPLVINLMPVKQKINNSSLTFGTLALNKDKKQDISTFNKGIVGLNYSQNERIVLNVLAILISNSTFQLYTNKNVDLTKTYFRFSKKIIRELSGITDVKPIITKLTEPRVFKNNNRGGKYYIDRLFHCKTNGNYYEFRFSKYLAYDFTHKSDKGYAKRRGFYNKKRNTIYETLFLELVFVKTAVFKDKKPPAIFEIKTKTLLENINLYNLVHEHKKRAVALLNSFFKASFEFGVFIGEMPRFDVKTLNRDSKDKISLKINPEFEWTNCDWNKWNVEKI